MFKEHDFACVLKQQTEKKPWHTVHSNIWKLAATVGMDLNVLKPLLKGTSV